MRWIGANLKLENTVGAILMIYLQGYLEVSICCFISLSQLKKEDFDGSNKSDVFAAVFACISALILVVLPVIIVSFIRRNFERLHLPEIYTRYGYLYEGLAIKSMWQSNFHVFYMGRRILFVSIIVFLSPYSGLQLVLHIILTMVYTIYFIIVQPYDEKERN
jgi:hypothetical protein